MCDYSLHAQKTRNAVKGDILEVYQFNSVTKGMRDATQTRPLHPDHQMCAVCLKPGTELGLVEPVVEMYNWPKWFPVFTSERKHRYATATFRKMNEEAFTQHHDGIEFLDGKQVLINNLKAGQLVTVLQVPAETKVEQAWGNYKTTSEDWSHLPEQVS